MSENRWPFNKDIVHHHGREITKAVFVIDTQPEPRPLPIGFELLRRFTSFTYEKLLKGFVFSDTESTISGAEVTFAEFEHPCSVAEVSTKSSTQAALLDAWRETDDDFSDIQWPPSSSGPDILSVKSKHYGSVAKVSTEAPTKAVLADANCENEDAFPGIQCPSSSSIQTTQLGDGDDDDIFGVGDCSDAVKISNTDFTLLWYQETQEDKTEDHHLECDNFDDLDHSMAGINECVMSYEDYIAQDIIQQFWSDMEEQLSSSALSGTATKSASYHTLGDCSPSNLILPLTIAECATSSTGDPSHSKIISLFAGLSGIPGLSRLSHYTGGLSAGLDA
ncbi:hypothetical protein CPLU01_11546 [Colletotrichum plurivorum]|uniref:Uncharacterized protein n=1 Tax=Colletotrichum plurivorum TaxID=2175906 RepID=A0A8H6K2D0_9PEZI|nr:hypothetical protein CPLU01_11546 [Colletotrichum plurivorum]